MNTGDLLELTATDAAAVADVLVRAAAMVRDRTERGAPSGDRRPRMDQAINRATTQLSADVDRSAVRAWAIRIAAGHVNAALGRAGHTSIDPATCERTLSGFGLDIGTLGQVDLAADILDQAARTAARR